MSVIGDPAEFKGEELKCSSAAFGEQNKMEEQLLKTKIIEN